MLEDLPQVRYATFDVWSSLGYKITKGSKAFWVEGVSYFNEFQVESNSVFSKAVGQELKEMATLIDNKLPF